MYVCMYVCMYVRLSILPFVLLLLSFLTLLRRFVPSSMITFPVVCRVFLVTGVTILSPACHAVSVLTAL